MLNRPRLLSFIIKLLLLIIFLSGATFLIPWRYINWGKMELAPSRTITVTGEAKTQERNQLASFTAGVTAINDNKETAVQEVNQKVEALINSVKEFGVKAEDIKTQNLSVNQEEEFFTDKGVQRRQPGQWRVSNSILITLREIDRASELADLLSSSGATNVYGPNFQLEETQKTEENLLSEAVENARKKAERMAQASGGNLGKVISVAEGYQNSPLRFSALEGLGGGGTPVEPGTSTVLKTVTVVFELN